MFATVIVEVDVHVLDECPKFTIAIGKRQDVVPHVFVKLEQWLEVWSIYRVISVI